MLGRIRWENVGELGGNVEGLWFLLLTCAHWELESLPHECGEPAAHFRT